MPTQKPILGDLVSEAGNGDAGIGKIILHINDLGNKMGGLEKSVSDISIEIAAVKTDFKDSLQRIADQLIKVSEKAADDYKEREKALLASIEKDHTHLKDRLDKLEQFKDRTVESQASAFMRYAPIVMSALTMLGGIGAFVLMNVKP